MTQFDPSHSEKQNVEEAKRKAALFRIDAVILGGTILTVPVLSYLAWTLNAWQLYAMTGLAVVLAIYAWIGLRVIRRGQSESSSWFIIIGGLVAMLIGVILTANLGMIIGFSAILLSSAVASQSLRGRAAIQANIVGVGAGILFALLDLLKLDFRLSVSALQLYLPGLTLVVVVIAGLLYARNSREQISAYWRSSIRNRLTVIVVGTAIIPVVLISIFLGGVTYLQVRSALEKEALAKLAAVQTIKSNQVTSYLAERQTDMVAMRETAAALRQEAIAKLQAVNELKVHALNDLFKDWDADVRDVAADGGVVTGIANLSEGYQQVGTAYVRALYLGKETVDDAGDGSAYSAAHLEQHLFFSGYTDIHGFEDAFLIDPLGNVVYSVHKSDVYGTNLVSGPFQQSSLASLFQNLKNTPANTVLFTDSSVISGQYAMFVGTPIYNGSILEGMLVYQLPVAEIDSIVQDRVGLTASAESFLISQAGEQIELRSNRVVKEGKIGDPKPGSDSEQALAGETGSDFRVGSTGVYEISVFRPLALPGLNWAIVTTSFVEEIFVPQLEGREGDFFAEALENYGFYDLFLISPDGFIFYSVGKEADYQTNILTGEFSNTNLASLVDEILESKAFEFVDFAFYAPSGGAPAAFFGIPQVNANGEVEMILAAQVSLADLNEILVETTGLGKSGETYLIGPDQLWRNDSRHMADLGAETTVLNPEFKVDTVASREALAGKSGQGVILGYRGTKNVLSVWSPLHIIEANVSRPEEQNWALIAAIDEDEALGPVSQLARSLGLIIGLAALVVGVLAVFVGARFALGFVAPILKLTDTATQVAAGNLDLRVTTDSVDEIGTLTTTFNNMTEHLQGTLEGLEQRVADRTKALATSAEVTRRLAAILDPRQLVSEVVNEVRSAFNYYYAQIYLLDESGENLVIAGGTGDAGAAMLAQKHAVPKGRGLVGRAADTNASVFVPDTYKEEGWLPNELLPETRAEAAVPISIGKQVYGVLDVQHSTVNGLTTEDIVLLESLAGQVAISLQNARSYEQSRKQAELESMVNVIGQRIQRTTSIEETLQTAIRELGTAIGATRVKASLRSALGASTPKPGETAEPVLADGIRKNGSSDPEGALAD